MAPRRGRRPGRLYAPAIHGGIVAGRRTTAASGDQPEQDQRREPCCARTDWPMHNSSPPSLGGVSFRPSSRHRETLSPCLARFLHVSLVWCFMFHYETLVSQLRQVEILAHNLANAHKDLRHDRAVAVGLGRAKRGRRVRRRRDEPSACEPRAARVSSWALTGTMQLVFHRAT